MLAPLRSVVQQRSRIKKNTWRECLLPCGLQEYLILCGVLFNIGVLASLRSGIKKKHLAGMLAPLRNGVQYRSACFSAGQNKKSLGRNA